MIDPAYMSAFAALVGTFVGGITSIATSWLGQQRQSKEQRMAREKAERRALYKQFIQEASKLYIDAIEHDTAEMAKFIDVYATLNRIRARSSRKVIEEADKALRTIVDTYSKENKTFSEFRQSITKGFIDPLRSFSDACHGELKEF